MALDYTGTAALMVDSAFLNRVKVACLKYATFITGEAITTPAHSTRIRWAQQTLVQPDMAVSQVTPTTVMDPAVQAAGGGIGDASLQSAVENSINKLI